MLITNRRQNLWFLSGFFAVVWGGSVCLFGWFGWGFCCLFVVCLIDFFFLPLDIAYKSCSYSFKMWPEERWSWKGKLAVLNPSINYLYVLLLCLKPYAKWTCSFPVLCRWKLECNSQGQIYSSTNMFQILLQSSSLQSLCSVFRGFQCVLVLKSF